VAGALGWRLVHSGPSERSLSSCCAFPLSFPIQGNHVHLAFLCGRRASPAAAERNHLCVLGGPGQPPNPVWYSLVPRAWEVSFPLREPKKNVGSSENRALAPRLQTMDAVMPGLGEGPTGLVKQPASACASTMTGTAAAAWASPHGIRGVCFCVYF